jgi:hypothetical protein
MELRFTSLVVTYVNPMQPGGIPEAGTLVSGVKSQYNYSRSDAPSMT